MRTSPKQITDVHFETHKICSRCELEKPIRSFDKQKLKGIYYYKPYCSACKSKRHRENNPEVRKSIKARGVRKYAQNRLQVKLDLMTHINQTVCKICGFIDVRALTFHHLDKNNKSFSISYGFTHCYSFERLLEEAKKCDVLCHNCHNIIHSKLLPIQAGLHTVSHDKVN